MLNFVDMNCVLATRQDTLCGRMEYIYKSSSTAIPIWVDGKRFEGVIGKIVIDALFITLHIELFTFNLFQYI